MAKEADKEPISITIDSELLKKLDEYCYKHDSDRSKITRRSLREFLEKNKL